MSLIHIYACCPLALQSGKLTHYFGPEKGRFLDPFPFSSLRVRPSWSNIELKENEKRRLLEIFIKLENSGCVKKSLADDIYNLDDKIESLLSELNKKESSITLAIVNDHVDFCSKSDRIYTLSEFQEKNKFTLNTKMLYMSPSAILDIIPNFIIQPSKRFKLIDPYFFEINDKSKYDIPNRFKFFVALIKKYYSYKENENISINIDIFGRDTGVLIQNVQEAFAKHIHMFQSNSPLNINFFLLKKKYQHDELPEDIKEFSDLDQHMRFFCIDGHNFRYENSIMDRTFKKEKQAWDYLATDDLNSYVNSFHENTKLYEIVHKFDLKQLEAKSRNQIP